MNSRIVFLCGVTLATTRLGTTPAAAQKPIDVKNVANPAGPSSIQAHWGITADGNPVLSWIDLSPDSMATLRYSIHRAAGWSDPRTIVSNRHFFGSRPSPHP